MPVSKAKFEEFCDDMLKMFKGLENGQYRNYDNPTASAMDFILTFNSTIFGDAVYNLFSPLARRTRSNYAYVIVEFQIKNADESTPQLSPEERIAAYNKLPGIVAAEVQNTSGRYGACLTLVCESISVEESKIKELVQTKMTAYQSQFDKAETYPEKNAVLTNMGEFYNIIRDSDTLQEFVNENNEEHLSSWKLV
ncbi:MAG: hypothetical protein PSV35_01000 [bacterium]|nr:hypothetical protein [bacterium]